MPSSQSNLSILIHARNRDLWFSANQAPQHSKYLTFILITAKFRLEWIARKLPIMLLDSRTFCACWILGLADSAFWSGSPMHELARQRLHSVQVLLLKQCVVSVRHVGFDIAAF